MTISFNHTIVASRDKRESAEFLAELFGLPNPKPFGHPATTEPSETGQSRRRSINAARASTSNP
jgi:hypothetical protein